MAWLNPATWAPVDAIQDTFSGLNNATYNPSAPKGGAPTTQFNYQPSTGGSQQSQPQIPLGGAGGGAQTLADTTSQGYAAPAAPAYSQGDLSTYNTQLQNLNNSVGDWTNQNASGYGLSIDNYVNKLRQGQQGIDEKGTQNELALKQGRAGVLDMISRGIRSGGVTLANRNASDSSAAGALANAYGDIGRRQLSSVGNQYEMENRNIGIAQQNFNDDNALNVRGLKQGESDTISAQVQQYQQTLAQLDAYAADKSLPERIQIEQEKAKIQAQIQAAIDPQNARLDQGVAGVQAMNVDQRRAQASSLANAGTAASNPFEFNTQTPAQFQNTGPFSGNLPIFTQPRKKTV